MSVIIELLALSYPPTGNGKSILDWQPFMSGDSLNQIIDEYNSRSLKVYKEVKEFGEQLINRFREELRANLHDLSDAIHKLWIDDFATIRVVLIDLEKIAGQDTTLRWLREEINGYAEAKKWQYYYIAQTSKVPGASSLSKFFKGTPTCFPEPEVLTEPEKLLEFLLTKICEPYTIAMREIVKSGPFKAEAQPTSKSLSDRTKIVYKASIGGILNEVRDAANNRNLNGDETAMLARHAAAQEFALSRIVAEVGLKAPTRVVLSSVRQPVMKIPIVPVSADPQWQDMDLLKITLNRSIRSLEPSQREVVRSLGIRGQNYTAVQVDDAETRDRVYDLRNVLDIDRFSAFMPSMSGSLK